MTAHLAIFERLARTFREGRTLRKANLLGKGGCRKESCSMPIVLDPGIWTGDGGIRCRAVISRHK